MDSIPLCYWTNYIYIYMYIVKPSNTTLVDINTLSTGSTLFLGAFANYEKRLLASSYPSVRPHRTIRLPLEGLKLNFMLWVLRKYVEEYQFWSKSVENSGYFTWITVCLYDNVSLNSSWNEKYCRQNSCGKSKLTFCIQLTFFNPKIMWFMR
jgi:hypothetical protein